MPSVEPAPEAVSQIALRAAPVSAADDRLLPVAAALEPLVGPGLHRGWVVAVAGPSSLAFALLASASSHGCWCAAVGFPPGGMAAIGELGVSLRRFPLVPCPPSSGRRGWPWVVGNLLAGVDAVLACPPSARLSAVAARQLSDRARHHGSVLVVRGAWPGPADLGIEVEQARWEGLGPGHGRVSARRMALVARGRGRATRERRAEIWLPSIGGGLETAEPVGAAEVVAPGGGRRAS